jgi:hypothetical protein
MLGKKKSPAEAPEEDRLVNSCELRGRAARALKLKGNQGVLRCEHGRLSFEEPDGKQAFSIPLEEVEILKAKRSGFLIRVGDDKLFVAPREKPRRKRPAFRPHDPISDAIWVPYLIMSARDHRHNKQVMKTWREALAQCLADGPVEVAVGEGEPAETAEAVEPAAGAVALA